MGHLFSISARIRSALSGQDGIALLMVLVVITILAALVVSFTDTTQKHLQVTQYYKNKLQAYWAAQSGLQATVGLLRMNDRMSAQAGQTKFDGATSPWDCESEAYQQAVPLLLANVFCESSMIEPALLLADPTDSESDTSLSRCPSAVPILDENRKLSLARLVEKVGTNREHTDEATFNRLKYLLQYLLKEADFAGGEGDQEAGFSLKLEEKTRIDIQKAEDLVRYLVDWMDTENSTTQDTRYNSDTAEQSCPMDGLPYEAKNGLLDSVDEIGLVCGFRQLPHTTIERLTRHLTSYALDTNINTATHPVLHAFCAAASDEPNETDSAKIFQALHYNADEESMPEIIRQKSDYASLLGNIADSDLIRVLRESTVFASTHFRVGIYGLVYNTETGTVLARAKVLMDLARRNTGGDFDVLYYRED